MYQPMVWINGVWYVAHGIPPFKLVLDEGEVAPEWTTYTYEGRVYQARRVP